MHLVLAFAALAAPVCPDGRVVGPDTAGACCWAGQAWNGEECLGTPRACPEGTRAQGYLCAATACKDGWVRLPSGHCCWPGQTWSTGTWLCEGEPTCPKGTRVVGGLGCLPTDTPRDVRATVARMAAGRALREVRPGVACTPGPDGCACPDGLAFAQDGLHCCGAGEAWSGERGGCLAGRTLREDGPATATDASRARVIGAAPGSLAPAQVEAVVAAARGRYAECFGGEGPGEADAAFVVEVDLAADGTPTASRAVVGASTAPVVSREGCVAAEVGALKFPAPGAAARAVVAFGGGETASE